MSVLPPIFTFTKAIKSSTVQRKEIPDPKDISKIAEVIERLELRPGVAKLGIDEIEIRTNPSNWVTFLFINTGIKHKCPCQE